MFVNALHIPVIMVIQLAMIHMALTELFTYTVTATSGSSVRCPNLYNFVVINYLFLSINFC